MENGEATQEWSLEPTEISELQPLDHAPNSEKGEGIGGGLLLENFQLGVKTIDVYGTITYANSVICNMLCYNDNELCQTEIWELLATESNKEMLMNHLAGIAQDNCRSRLWEGEYVCKDGKTLILLSVEWHCMRSSEGEVTGFIGFIRNKKQEIKNKKQKAENCKSENGNLIDSPVSGLQFPVSCLLSIVSILMVDKDDNIIYVNEKFAEIIGCFKEEVCEMNISDIMPPNHLEALKTALKKIKDRVILDIEFITRNMKVLPTEIIALPCENNILIIGRDISHRKEMEKEQIRHQRFEAITTFAEGIVNDLNDFLTAVLGNIDLAHMAAEAGSKIQERLSDARQGCMGLKDLTRQLISLSRRSILKHEASSILKLIKNTAESISNIPNIRCDYSVVADIWHVAFDDDQMRQVMEHLVNNAKEAMPSGGKIEIRAENAVASDIQVDYSCMFKPACLLDRYVKISVQDQGIGISEDSIQRIFDPYFSTKAGTKRGTGLGLTIAYAAVRRHQGFITVDSKPGRTIFNIFLPASEIPTSQTLKKAGNTYTNSIARVLIMDDEEIVREVIGNMLRQLGYEPSFSANGAEAVEAYLQAMEDGKPFDVVLLDLHVENGIGGKEAIKNLIAVDPFVKGIVSSSYANDPEMIDYDRYGFCGVVEKPYSIAELDAALKKAVSD